VSEYEAYELVLAAALPLDVLCDKSLSMSAKFRLLLAGLPKSGLSLLEIQGLELEYASMIRREQLESMVEA